MIRVSRTQFMIEEIPMPLSFREIGLGVGYGLCSGEYLVIY